MNAPGTMIGPYKLLNQISEGSAGVVFLAEQTEPERRQVAVKILNAHVATLQLVARFEAERQALALMDHLNIVRMLDGGTVESGQWEVNSEQQPAASSLATGHYSLPTVGLPYFVMELVDGAPITDFCEQHHLSRNERLDLFVQLCRAVQHAHQKGIIHRGLKPADVLVTRQGRAKGLVKLIDFGIAKATGQQLTDKTLVTGFGAIVGTPEYRSPEQAEINQLDIDTRSDIYSLGVLLHEVLTGKTPSESITLLRGELKRIVMRCLEKDRDRRYPTAEALALDIHRFLSRWSNTIRSLMLKFRALFTRPNH